MWLNRKPRNRRLERDYVLDVKLRSSQVRASRTRKITVFLGALLGIVVAVYSLGCAGQWIINRLVYENKAFAIEDVDVQTDGVIAVEQLRRWSGVHLGQNLLRLDLARVRRDLELVSLIQSVSVERVLPHLLRIRVIERLPIAQIKLLKPSAAGGIETGVFLLDAEGYVILPLDPREQSSPSNPAGSDLPVITGLKGPEIRAGRKIESPQLLAALQLLVDFNRSPMQTVADLKTIDLSSPEVVLATTDQGSAVTFGLRDVDRQLRRWRQIFYQGQQINKAIATLDLAVSNSLPVRWLEASAVPAPGPKPSKLPRKKHV